MRTDVLKWAQNWVQHFTAFILKLHGSTRLWCNYTAQLKYALRHGFHSLGMCEASHERILQSLHIASYCTTCISYAWHYLTQVGISPFIIMEC